MKSERHFIEALEPRIAPASVLAFTDVDGDKVKITSSVGDLNAPGVATFDASGHQLQRLTLTDPSFQGASIATSVARSSTGDGLVNIGRINADGRDLGNVTVKGDLGAIICGDANDATPGLNRLEVRSMGVYGVATQGGVGDLFGAVEGRLGTLIVHGDIRGSTIGARSFPDSAAGSVGVVRIGGSLIAGAGADTGGIFSTGDMGSVKIGGDIIGGLDVAGRIGCNGTLGSVEVGGSLIGGTGVFSGEISGANIGSVKIHGDILAGSGDDSSGVRSNGKIGSLAIGGSLVGGPGDQQFSNGIRFVEGQVIALGAIGSVSIGGNMVGGSGAGSAEIRSAVAIGKVTVGGAVVGGAGAGSGQIISEGTIGTISIQKDLAGGSGASSGSITATGRTAAISINGSILGGRGNGSGQIFSTGELASVKVLGNLVGGSISQTDATLIASGYIEGNRIGSVFIGGSVLTGTDDSPTGSLIRNGAIRAVHSIGSLTVKGSLISQVGKDAVTRVAISAAGEAGTTGSSDVAIGSISIGGRAERADILAGYDVNLVPQNGNASIGTVKVGGDWVAGNIVAGILAPPGGFGTGGTVINNGADAIIARIASITIGGVVAGTSAPGDHFGFTAQQIGAFKAFGVTAPLHQGASNDVIELSPTTGDVTIREV